MDVQATPIATPIHLEMVEHESKPAATPVAKLEQASLAHTRELAYWRVNLRVVGVLLTIWFSVSYGAGILFVEQLNQFELGGFPLGFWFAQQGAIYVFVALIFIYVWIMNKIDHRFGVDE